MERWKLPFLTKIYLASDEACERPLFSYWWPGTKEACLCSYDASYPELEYLLARNCTSKLIGSYGCRDVEGVEGRTMTSWRNSKLCGSYSKESLYEEECRGEARCSEGEVGTCFEECPISEISASK